MMYTTKTFNPLLPSKAVIRNITAETPNVYSILLSLQSDNFYFKPGQFNMLGLPGIGEAPFSFSMIDAESNSLVHTIRKAGNVVHAIEKLQTGEVVNFRGPYGKGWPLEKLKDKNVIVAAGGIGIAPLRPVIHYLLDNRESFRQICLFYGAKTPESLLFQNDLKSWSSQMQVNLSADIIDQPTSLNVKQGVVTKLFNQIDFELCEAVTFTCGPQIMMKFVAAELILKGHNPEDIYVSMERRMKCGIAHCGHCQIGAKYVCKDGPVFCLTEIQKYADTFL